MTSPDSTTRIAARISVIESIRGFTLKGIRIDKEELKHKIIMPEYLRFAMRDAIKSKGAESGLDYANAANGEAPEGPLVVFINSRSGGRHGPELKVRLQELMSEEQVQGPAMNDGSRQYQWKELRFSFKEDAQDVETFCRQLVDMEEEAVKSVSRFSGLG